GLLKIAACEHFAQIDHLTLLVWQLNTNNVAAWHNCNAGGYCAHGAGNIICKSDNARGFDSRSGFEFVKGDDGTGLYIDDFAAHAEIFQNAFKKPGILLKHFAGKRSIALDLLGFGKKMQRRHFKCTAIAQTCVLVATSFGGGTRCAFGTRGRGVVPFLSSERGIFPIKGCVEFFRTIKARLAPHMGAGVSSASRMAHISKFIVLRAATAKAGEASKRCDGAKSHMGQSSRKLRCEHAQTAGASLFVFFVREVLFNGFAIWRGAASCVAAPNDCTCIKAKPQGWQSQHKRNNRSD